MVATRILRSRYLDSVVLMRLAQALATSQGVEDAAAMMGTDANKQILAAGGFLDDAAASAAADDLIVAVKAGSQQVAAAALNGVDALLAAPSAGADEALPVRSLEDALAVRPDLNLAAVSLPGEYAAREAERALESGLHVFLFSSNVELEDEVRLKRLAAERGLLCMGPDCGTAIIAGMGLGFANAVRRGPVGVVGATGTGIQVVTSLLDRFGIGISHAIGCGSRDLSEAVGARTALTALAALEQDDETEVIVVVSKPAAASVAATLRERAAVGSKPVVFCFLGGGEAPWTLDEAARAAAAACGHGYPELEHVLGADAIAELRSRLAPSQRFVRGLFAGGTLAYEAQLVLAQAGVEVAFGPASQGHAIVDLGAEEFTRGRPHPMIDARSRCARLREEARDPEVAVVLLDVVLGFGAATDPAGDLAADIAAARERTAAAGRELVVLASICGTEHDLQGLEAQADSLRRSGAVVLETNAAAARTAAMLVAGQAEARLVSEAAQVGGPA